MAQVAIWGDASSFAAVVLECLLEIDREIKCMNILMVVGMATALRGRVP